MPLSVANPDHSDVNSDHLDVSPDHSDVNSDHLDVNSDDLDVNSDHSDVNSDHLDVNSGHLDVSPDYSDANSDNSFRIRIIRMQVRIRNIRIRFRILQFMVCWFCCLYFVVDAVMFFSKSVVRSKKIRIPNDADPTRSCNTINLSNRNLCYNDAADCVCQSTRDHVGISHRKQVGYFWFPNDAAGCVCLSRGDHVGISHRKQDGCRLAFSCCYCYRIFPRHRACRGPDQPPRRRRRRAPRSKSGPPAYTNVRVSLAPGYK